MMAQSKARLNCKDWYHLRIARIVKILRIDRVMMLRPLGLLGLLWFLNRELLFELRYFFT